MILVILFFVLIPKPFGHAVFRAWCDLQQLGCGKTPNSMCIYDENPFKGACLNMVDGAEKEIWIRDYWLALINSFRDRVASGAMDPWPTAANMKQLIWDDLLASQARRWNFQCILYRPDDCNKNPTYGKQQIAQIQASIRDVNVEKFTRQMQALFESVALRENDISDSGIESLVDGGLTEDMVKAGGAEYLMASLMMATIERVGASLIVSDWENPNYTNILRTSTYLAPIDYASPMYERGKPCSMCPPGWSCSKGVYSNLCALPHYPRDSEYIVAYTSDSPARNYFYFSSFTLVLMASLATSL